MRNLIVVWVWLLLGVSGAGAVAEESEPRVRTELVALSIYDPVEELFYLNDGELETFRSGGVGLGQPMPYEGPARLRLYRARGDLSGPLPGEEVDEEAPPPEPVAEVELPQGEARVLLLCFLHEDQPLAIQPFPASFEDMNTGSYQVFNFAPTEARLLLGDELVRVPSRAREQVSNAEWQNERQGLRVQVGTEVDGEFRMVYSSVWGHDPERRYFVFVFEGTHSSMPLQIRKVHDRRPPPPPED